MSVLVRGSQINGFTVVKCSTKREGVLDPKMFCCPIKVSFLYVIGSSCFYGANIFICGDIHLRIMSLPCLSKLQSGLPTSCFRNRNISARVLAEYKSSILFLASIMK